MGAERVCVTGSTGYLGSHLVKLLLERGYAVRALVRDPNDAEKVAHLRELRGELELHPVDLGSLASVETALRGSTLLCHLAASTRLKAPDPERQIVDPAVVGTRNALDAACRVGVRRVVLTSSIAAVVDDERPADHVFTEADWNRSASLKNPYPLAKTLAERAAWSFHAGLRNADRIELVTLCPSVMQGPLLARIHLRSSPATLRDLLLHKLPACPALYFNLVDVRDAAQAHLAALERPGVSGRYIVHAQGLWMQDMAKLIAGQFPDFQLPTRHLPGVVAYAAAIFGTRLTVDYLRKNLNRTVLLDNRRGIEELGLTYRPLEDTLQEGCRSMIDRGFVKH